MSGKAIIATLPEKLKQAEEETAFRLYVAECARITTENTAKFGGGGYMKATFGDFLKPKSVDKRSGEEIAADIIKRAGLKVAQNEPI